jgi:hypothetical protein
MPFNIGPIEAALLLLILFALAMFLRAVLR